MQHAYIAFGANLSNPRETLPKAVSALGEMGVIINNVSSLWRSPAWPEGSHALDYINAVLAVQTRLNPTELMQNLLQIETRLGRMRAERNAPRLIDLDLIDYDGQISDSPDCVLPHPRMTNRAFVLLPLREIAPHWVHPNGATVADLLANLDVSQTRQT